ncbi:hypothetical protein INTERNEXUS_184 [Bacillus phage vB_BspM_Internexus]|nr:hypothetical protein INTERNEXUS_184 [Bacillus phage vB_BspM_Internexus]
MIVIRSVIPFKWKWGAPYLGEDIVSSLWKHRAVHKRTH